MGSRARWPADNAELRVDQGKKATRPLLLGHGAEGSEEWEANQEAKTDQRMMREEKEGGVKDNFFDLFKRKKLETKVYKF